MCFLRVFPDQSVLDWIFQEMLIDYQSQSGILEAGDELLNKNWTKSQNHELNGALSKWSNLMGKFMAIYVRFNNRNPGFGLRLAYNVHWGQQMWKKDW